MEVLTLGHSVRPAAEVMALLSDLRVGFVVDVRRFPGEKKNPGFGKEAVDKACLDLGITYLPLGKELGGARSEGYKEHVDTDAFRHGLAEVMDLARKRRTLLLCAEAFYFRCHRKYVADELVRGGFTVTHVLDAERSLRHRLGSYRLLHRPDECE